MGKNKGLNTEEVAELVKFIAKNNSWEHLYECNQSGRKVPKYYSMSYDTRTNDMWKITFYEVTGKNCDGKLDTEYVFRTERDYNLKDKIYEWLNEIN